MEMRDTAGYRCEKTGAQVTGIPWGRGFFRLWLLLAIAWVGIGAAIGVGSILKPYVARQVMAIPAETNAVTMFPSWGSEHTDLRTLVTSGAMKEHLIGEEGYSLYMRTEAPDDRLAARIAEAEGLLTSYMSSETGAQRSRMIPMVLGWVLLPPLMVLVVGWAIGWAISGFRRTS